MSDQRSALQPSEEFDERQRDLAGDAGEANQRALRHMIGEVAQTGAQREVGDYVVGVAIEEAEGMYELGEDGFEWREPGEENCHLEVSVSDAADGRFLPELTVEAVVEPVDVEGEQESGGEREGEGEAVGPVEVPFVWHPGLYHYGINLTLPGDGTYDVRVHVEAPTFRRHDRENGDRFGDSVETTFEGLEIETGQS